MIVGKLSTVMESKRYGEKVASGHLFGLPLPFLLYREAWRGSGINDARNGLTTYTVAIAQERLSVTQCFA
jgi:hypothetical protein